MYVHIVEFQKWKDQLEATNMFSYVYKSKSNSTNGDITYYYCNRTKSSYKDKANGKRARAQKSQGFSKMSTSCISFIKAMNENGKLRVEWQQTHYGHQLELQHLRLHKTDKQLIAFKLIEGVPPRKFVQFLSLLNISHSQTNCYWLLMRTIH